MNKHKVPIVAAIALGALMIVGGSFSATAARSAACSFCGKNLIKNPGAEGGRGQNASGETGNVPGWTNTAGGFGAAAYTGFGIGWFTATSMGPKNRGKNYFFGGTTTAATSAPASIGTQTIKLPAAAAGHKATLSGWLGNYSSNTAQVRAAFMDSSNKVLSAIRIGPDTTIGGGNMALRTRNGIVPPKTASVNIVVTFTDHANDNLAGADDLSLVLS
jgi:hypothetical protein